MPLYNPAAAAVTDATISTSDTTTNNASTAKHGFLLKLDNTSTHYMNGQGAWGTPAGTGAVASDPIWDAAGDLAVGSGADTAVKLALGSAGKAAVSDGSTVVYGYPYGSVLAVARIVNAANYTTTSATQADVDSSVAITFTAPASGNVLVEAVVAVNMSANVQNASLGLRESTTNLVNGTSGSFAIQGNAAANSELQVAWAAYLTGISAGSHTYKLAFSVNGGATFIIRSFVGAPIHLKVTSCP